MAGSLAKRRGVVAWMAVAVGSLSLVVLVFGQSQVLVEYDGEELPVFSMDGSIPQILVNRKPVSVEGGRLRVEQAPAFTDGAIDVLNLNALMGQDYGSAHGGFFFRFEAIIEAERDFEDCFVLFVISPKQGDPTYIIREIPDINQTGSERIAVTLPVNPGFGGGSFAYKLFSRGEEIQRRDGDGPISVAKMGEPRESEGVASSFRRSGSPEVSNSGEPAEVLKERLLDFPEELLGKVAGGYATAIYSIDERGDVIELIDLKLDHNAFAPEVLKTLVGSKYKPGRYEGRPLVTTVKQSFFFNEFAPFAEAMEMIPYPKIKDRDAVAVHTPVPGTSGGAVRAVTLELSINKLGRVVQCRVIEASDDETAGAISEMAKDWVFLPAIVDGYPADQTLELPVSF